MMERGKLSTDLKDSNENGDKDKNKKNRITDSVFFVYNLRSVV